MPVIAAVAEWDNLMRRLAAAAPEALASDGRALNLMEGEWKELGFGRHYTSSVDGRSLGRIPMIDLEAALRAVRFAKSEAEDVVESGPGPTQAARDGMSGRAAPGTGTDRAAADLGNWQALRAGADRHRPLHQRGGVVRREYRTGSWENARRSA